MSKKDKTSKPKKQHAKLAHAAEADHVPSSPATILPLKKKRGNSSDLSGSSNSRMLLLSWSKKIPRLLYLLDRCQTQLRPPRHHPDRFPIPPSIVAVETVESTASLPPTQRPYSHDRSLTDHKTTPQPLKSTPRTTAEEPHRKRQKPAAGPQNHFLNVKWSASASANENGRRTRNEPLKQRSVVSGLAQAVPLVKVHGMCINTGIWAAIVRIAEVLDSAFRDLDDR
jgi:hypothetical protein